MVEIDLREVDNLTPFYQNLLQKLSVQERKVVATICRFTGSQPITAKRVSEISRILQTNHVHAVLGRLAQKGFLEKVERSTYRVRDQKLAVHLRCRSGQISSS